MLEGVSPQNADDVLTGPPPSMAGARPDVVEVAFSVAAFVLLLQRYTGESEFHLRAMESGPDGSVEYELTLSLETSMPGGEVVERTALALQAGAVSRPSWSPRRLHLVWTAGADESAGALALRIEMSPRQTLDAHLLPATGGAGTLFGARAAVHWRRLREGLKARPQAPVTELSLVTPDERTLLLERWSGAPFDSSLARDELLPEVFEHQADAHASAVAVECGDQRLTYGELERRANQLAHALRARGIGRGHLVGLALPRSPDVYVALLGILKAGAAYVPLDADYPAERVAGILADAQSPLLVTISSQATRYGALVPLLLLDQERDELARQPTRRLTRSETGSTPGDVCYVIYTSGSTGKPKGVQVEHRNVCNLVRTEGQLFQVRPYDRVFQGFSIAFDASVEEVWLAFFAGATLVVGTREMIQAGPELSRLLTEARISVLSCVPTLLSIMEGDIPTVRLLILGGEAAPQHLVRRWTRPGRRVVNTYGPTEATVIATAGDCTPDGPVTIGRPIPNYRVFILDERQQLAPLGVPGELCIGGAGVARGYLGRADLTAERFIDNPFGTPDVQRLYRSGDLVRFSETGEIEFLGRIDAQVKLRGFRVELSEIESVLLQCPGVRGAAVALRQDNAVQQLVGYVIPTSETLLLDEDVLRAHLRRTLPSYMVPGLIEVVREFPVLPSGKVDRKRLPAPKPRLLQRSTGDDPPRTPTEQALAQAWEESFKPARVSLHDDFFLDLGGHSLLAATLVSSLRQRPEFRTLSVLDIYAHPTVHKLAAHLDAARRASIAPVEKVSSVRPVSRLSYALTSALQALSLYLVFGLFSTQWMTPYFTYSWWVDTHQDKEVALLVSLGVMLGLYPAMLVISILAKWLIIGRFRPGVYRLWSFYYVRWWLVNRILAVVPIDYLNGTPLLYLYYRLLGARIGRNVYIATDNLRMFDLISIGDGTSIGADTSLLGYSVEDGLLKVGRIDIGRHCFVGARSVISENIRMEDGARLYDQSMLPPGSQVPAGETWLGSPARRADALPEEPGEAIGKARTSRRKRFLFGTLHAVGSFLLPLAILLAALPGILLMRAAGAATPGEWYLLSSPVAGTSFVVLLALEIVLVKWLLLGRVRAGRYPLQSFFYWRKWMVDQLMDLSLDVLGPLYATLYLAPWYRLLGAKLGSNAEISTASNTLPDLLTLGDETFIADGVCLGAARVEHGYLTLAPTQVGHRAFIGNSAVVPARTTIGEDSLVGVLSLSPLSLTEAAQPNRSWLGSPAIFLPQRLKNNSFDEETTFKPTRRLFAVRAVIELVRIILPVSMFFLMTAVLIDATSAINRECSLLATALVFPLLFLLCAAAASLFVVAVKWLLMGRYRPTEKPLWCSFVWLNELVTALHEHIANPLLVEHLLGTPFAAWFFRAMGSKIGSRVYIDTTQFTEYDLVRIASHVVLNAECTIQTHLFEDRVMKMSTIDIGEGCSVGTTAVVLYDTRMEAGSSLRALSLLMKGEVLPAGTRWEGAPARPLRETPAALPAPAEAA